METTKIEELIIDSLCKYYGEHGKKSGLPTDQIHEIINTDEYIKEKGGAKFGLVESILDSLKNRRIILYEFDYGGYYKVSGELYLKWHETKQNDKTENE